MIAGRERACFAAGDLGFNFVWQSIELYLLFFYIRVVGLNPEIASAIFLAGALVDWVLDPVVGVLVDRAAPRIPLRRWVLIGGPAAGIALVAAFAQPALPGGWMLGYALTAHIVLRVAYSVGNIPYGALTTRISKNRDDQVALTAARMQGAAIGGLTAAIVYAALPARSGHGTADFVAGACLLAVLALPAFLATYYGVRERVATRGTGAASKSDGSELFRLVRQSPRLRRLLATIVAAGLSVTVLNKSILFLFDRLDATLLGYAVAVVPAMSLLLTVPLWLRLARRIGCVRTLSAAATLNAAAALTIGVAGHSLGVIVAAVCISLVAGAGMSVMFWALLPGVVDEIERRSGGTACAARVYALGGMARKLAQALAPQFIALGLSGSAGGSVVPAIVVVALLTLVIVAAYPPAGGVPVNVAAPA